MCTRAPAGRQRRKLISQKAKRYRAMTTQRTRGETKTLNGQPVGARPEVGWERRITTLEARVEHLEVALEGFQDAVYRQSVLEGRRIAELGRRTAPHEMARALSQDARRHGV
jgi:hypothetical protein